MMCCCTEDKNGTAITIENEFAKTSTSKGFVNAYDEDVPGEKSNKEEPAVVDLSIKAEKQVQVPREGAEVVKGQVEEGLVVMFETPDGEDKRKVFKVRPMGLVFDNKMPIVVKEISPGMQAEHLAIQTGWIFKEVAGKDAKAMDFFSALQLFTDEVNKLPTAFEAS